MKVFLNAGFGELLPPDDLDLIRSLGYAGIRQNVHDPRTAKALVDNVLDYGLEAIFIVPVHDETLCQETAHALAAACTEGAAIEVGNEEDLGSKRWSHDPRGWAALVKDVVTIAWDHCGADVPVISGGVSSLSREAMRWLEESRVSELPVAIGYHQYRHTPVEVPMKGYDSRESEFRRLRDVAKDLPVWCTESGWHTAPQESGTWPWKKHWTYTDDDVARFLSREIEYNRSVAEAFVVYQLNDGPHARYHQDRYGIRRTDGTLKPSAKAHHVS